MSTPDGVYDSGALAPSLSLLLETKTGCRWTSASPEWIEIKLNGPVAAAVLVGVAGELAGAVVEAAEASVAVGFAADPP